MKGLYIENFLEILKLICIPILLLLLVIYAYKIKREFSPNKSLNLFS